MSSVEIPNSTELNAMSRADLDALAESLGLDPEEYSNRTLEIQAIKDMRVGDTPEVVAAMSASVEEFEAEGGGYPPYMPITPGQREPGQEDPAPAVTTLTKVPDGDVDWGETVYFLTGPDVFPHTSLRVKALSDPDDAGIEHELYSLDLPCGSGATTSFRIGPTSLWTEHSTVHGNGTATIINVDPDHGGETEGESISFGIGAPSFPHLAEVEEVPWEQRAIPVLGSEETVVWHEQVAADNAAAAEEAAQQPA